MGYFEVLFGRKSKLGSLKRGSFCLTDTNDLYFGTGKRNINLSNTEDILRANAKIPKGKCSSKYITKEAELLEGFSNVSDWTLDNCTASLETSNTINGNCLKVVPTTTGNPVKITKTVAWDLSSMSCLSFWVYVPDRTIFSGTATIYISSVDTWAKWCHYDFSNSIISNGWNCIKLLPSQFLTDGGSGDTLGSSMITFRISIPQASGKKFEYLLFDHCQKDKVDIPSVVLMFDDCWSDVYNNAFPYMRLKNIRGSTAVISNFVGTGAYSTLQQIKELYDNGWDICNHTIDHTDLSTISDYATAKTKIEGCKNWGLKNGFIRGNKIMINPYGLASPQALQAMCDLEMEMARTTIYDNQPAEPKDFFQIKTQAAGQTTTLNTLKGYVDSAIATGSSLWVMLHKVSDDGNGLSLPIATFKGFIDYIAQKNIKTYTASEWLEWAKYYSYM